MLQVIRLTFTPLGTVTTQDKQNKTQRHTHTQTNTRDTSIVFSFFFKKSTWQDYRKKKLRNYDVLDAKTSENENFCLLKPPHWKKNNSLVKDVNAHSCFSIRKSDTSREWALGIVTPPPLKNFGRLRHFVLLRPLEKKRGGEGSRFCLLFFSSD